MNPKKFGKIANEKQEPWKAPLPVFIERIYPPTQKATVFETVDECVEGTYEARTSVVEYASEGSARRSMWPPRRDEGRPYEACGGATGFSPSGLHFKRFGRERPVDVKSIEEIIRAKEKKKEEQRKRKLLERESKESAQKVTPNSLETT